MKMVYADPSVNLIVNPVLSLIIRFGTENWRTATLLAL